MLQSPNILTIVGDSSLDIAQIARNITNTDSLHDGTHRYTIANKYYHADIDVHPLYESDLIQIHHPDKVTSDDSDRIPVSDLLARAKASIAVFDASMPEGFERIKRLYGRQVISRLTDVDTHILLGCCHDYTTIQRSQIRKYQQFALNNGMEFVFLPNHTPEVIDKVNTVSHALSQLDIDDVGDSVDDTDTTTTHDDNDDSGADDDDSDDGDDGGLEPDEIGYRRIHDALSCCAWAVITRPGPAAGSTKPPTTSMPNSEDKGRPLETQLDDLQPGLRPTDAKITTTAEDEANMNDSGNNDEDSDDIDFLSAFGMLNDPDLPPSNGQKISLRTSAPGGDETDFARFEELMNTATAFRQRADRTGMSADDRKAEATRIIMMMASAFDLDDDFLDSSDAIEDSDFNLTDIS